MNPSEVFRQITIFLALSLLPSFAQQAPPSAEHALSVPQGASFQRQLAGLPRADRPKLDPEHRYTLPELVDIAEMNNPETRVAWEQARASAAAAGIARSALFPTVAALASASLIRTSLAVSLFGLLVLATVSVSFPWREPGADWTVSWQCLIRIIVFATLAALILAVPMRRAAMLSPSGKGAALGAAAGLAGVAIQQFACVHQQASHILIWHGRAVAIAATAGAVAGRMFRRISFRHA